MRRNLSQHVSFVNRNAGSGPAGLRPQPLRRCSGFTLMELLISMTVLSLLATTILFSWRIAAGAWQKASTHLERSRTVLAVNQLLEEQMASMVPYHVVTSNNIPALFFQGEALTARFLSRYSMAGRTNSGLYRIEYQIVDGPDGSKQLLMNEYAVRSREELASLMTAPDPSLASQLFRFAPFQRTPQTFTLIEGLKDCRFEYYQPPLPPDPGSWVSRWTSTQGELPRSMAIRIVAPANTADLMPVSVVAAIRNFSSAADIESE
jgi:prepilin-type N-terminal cleavage/methylation domain-containing protein